MALPWREHPSWSIVERSEAEDVVGDVVEDGGAVLDTPGLRGVGLHDAGDGLERAFADLDALAAACRFAGVIHQ